MSINTRRWRGLGRLTVVAALLVVLAGILGCDEGEGYFEYGCGGYCGDWGYYGDCVGCGDGWFFDFWYF